MYAIRSYYAERVLHDFLAESGQEVARVSTGIALDEEEGTPLDHEWPPAEAADAPAEDPVP